MHRHDLGLGLVQRIGDLLGESRTRGARPRVFYIKRIDKRFHDLPPSAEGARGVGNSNLLACVRVMLNSDGLYGAFQKSQELRAAHRVFARAGV
jgi:hypothetical protein